MNTAIAEIAIDPIGTQSPDESDYIVAAERVLKQAIAAGADLRYRINPMGTTLEGPAETVFAVLQKMHAAPFFQGAPRVISTIRIDERRDREASMARAVDVVERKLAVTKAEMC